MGGATTPTGANAAGAVTGATAAQTPPPEASGTVSCNVPAVTVNNSTTPSADTVGNAVKLVGEAVVPGASLLMDGNVVGGAAHLLVGVAARVALGPLGLLLVAANSYSQSTTGKHLWNHMADVGRKASAQMHSQKTA